MRRLRGTGLAIIVLAGMSGCAGVQRHLSWPSHEMSQADDADSPRFGWSKRPATDRSFASDPSPASVETAQSGPVMSGMDAGRDIWSAEHPDGIARYFPNTIRTWNRFTSRIRGQETERVDEMPVQTSRIVESERTALNKAARDRQVKTVRMTDSGDERSAADARSPRATISRRANSAVGDDEARVGSADTTTFYEPTAVGRPRPLTYADLMRDPAANEAVIEGDNLRPAASRVDLDAAPVTMLVAMNDSPRTVALTDTAIPAEASTAGNAGTGSSESSATDMTQPGPSASGGSASSVSPNGTDGSATAAIRRGLREIRTSATESVADASTAAVVGTPATATSRGDEPVARLASNADVPASAGVAASVVAVNSTPVAKPAPTPVAVSGQQSPLPSPQAGSASAPAHKHVLLGWLCPLKTRTHSVLPSSQLPTPAYPTSYDSCNTAKVAKCDSVAASPQAEGCAEAHTPKKPCFLKTWLHTSAQASLEEPAVLPMPQTTIAAPAPKKPCFLKTMFHHHDTTPVAATPQASPQSSVVEASAVRKPCFLKVWMHTFDHQPTAGCTCAGCSTGDAHCCCVSQRSCGFKHFTVYPTGQHAVTPSAAPAAQAAKGGTASQSNEVVRTRSGGAEADDVAEKRQLQGGGALSASSDDLDKSPQG